MPGSIRVIGCVVCHPWAGFSAHSQKKPKLPSLSQSQTKAGGEGQGLHFLRMDKGFSFFLNEGICETQMSCMCHPRRHASQSRPLCATPVGMNQRSGTARVDRDDIHRTRPDNIIPTAVTIRLEKGNNKIKSSGSDTNPTHRAPKDRKSWRSKRERHVLCVDDCRSTHSQVQSLVAAHKVLDLRMPNYMHTHQLHWAA